MTSPDIREAVARIIDPWAFKQCELAIEQDNDEVLRKFLPSRDLALARADAIIALLLGGEEGQGWRPIETAPEDGSFVLGCQLPDEPLKGWHKSWEQWKAPLTIAFRAFHPNAPGKEQWRDAKGSPVRVTHWKPLISPPNPRDDEGAGS